MTEQNAREALDPMDHVAIVVKDIARAVDFYTRTFRCAVAYQDESWALLKFSNIRLALVLEGSHPGHLGFRKPDAARWGELKVHRDGTRSCYIEDPSGNAVEFLEAETKTD